MKRSLEFISCAALMLVAAHTGLSDDPKAKEGKKSVSKSDASDQSQLTINRIFHDKEFELKSYSARWIDGTNEFSVLQNVDGEKEQKEIKIFDPSTDQFTTLIPAEELTPHGHETPLKVDGYQLSDDRSKVLIYTNSQRVWRQNTRGDYWLIDRETKQLSQLGGDGPEATMMFAKFSPDGKKIAFVRDRNVYVEDLASHEIRQLTETANEFLINGTTDWVYEEEFQVRDGFRWCPDSKSIAYWQIDTTDVDQFPLVNNTDTLYPKVQWFAYPKVGQKNPACRVGVVTVDNGETQWMKVPGDQRNHYIPRMDWAENSDQLLIQQLNRLQNSLTLFLANSQSGVVTPIMTETDDAWIDVHDEIYWLGDGKQFTWLSDRDGWRHAYLISRDGKETKLLTPGDFDVIQLLKVDEERQCFYYIASPDDATQRFLFCGYLDGRPAVRLTPDDQPGVHRYQFSDNAEWAIHITSNANWPGLTELISVPDHKRVRLLEDNQKVAERIAKLDLNPVEFFQVSIGDGVKLDAWCHTPPNFDLNSSYPLLVYVYGEPAGTTVVNQWAGTNHLWHMYLAQQGYVVMSFDNRGTKVPRGREFRKSIYEKIGILPPQDQAAAVKAVLKERPYLDRERVGVWGWSGGGSSSLQAIFKYPELYSTAIAIASVPDQRYYDTIYQERYMGLPKDNPEAFQQGSPINFAQNLEGNLLLIHGTGDDNCHYQTAELLIDKLIAHDKQFSLMAYPNRSHSIKERENTQRHLRTLMTQFLKQHLPVNVE